MRPEVFRGVFRDDDLARAVYSEGAGISREIPVAVAVPADADDAQSLVKWAALEKQALIPRGSGSGMAGGAVGPGLIVDLSRLRALGEIDKAKRRVRVDSGVICKTVDNAARREGLRFPVDPSSAAFCTIGGMASTNAAGPHSLKFGATREWVHSLDCIFADGSRAVIARGEQPPKIRAISDFLARADSLRKTWAFASTDHAAVRKDSSGYALAKYFSSGELVDLLVGSEGSLALVVGVELDLAPAPGHTSSLLAGFGSLESAARGAEAARNAGASACELLDKTFLDLAATAESEGRAEQPAAVLLIELEAADQSASGAAAAALRAALLGAGAETVNLALTSGAEKEIWELRHAASPILSRLKKVVSMQFIEDGAVPPSKLPEYILGVRAALQRQSVAGVIFGHAGDSHVHVNPLIDVTTDEWRAKASSLLEDVVELTARLGGTLCGEHGDGRLRTPLMPRVWSSAALNAFAEVKRCFDPDGILNPGVKIPVAGQKPLGAIKYDPSLAWIPVAARKALDGVVANRSYGDFRLSLID